MPRLCNTFTQNCEFCEGNDFILRNGCYICSNCNVQSQNIEEQAFEYIGDTTAREEGEIQDTQEQKTCKIQDDGRLLTSWECYNHVLKGLVEELIQLGASESLRFVTFQLWAGYLSKANIAFFTEIKNQLPLLPVGFCSRDAEILYGVPNLRKKMFDGFLYPKKQLHNSQKESEEVLEDVPSTFRVQKFRRRSRQLLSELESDSSTKSDKTVQSNISLNNLEESQTSFCKRMKVSFKATAHKTLNEMSNIVKKAKLLPDDEVAHKRAIKTIKRRMFDTKRYNKEDSNLIINMSTVISVIQIALLIIGEDIQLGDLLRWITEGRLSVNQADKFIPNSEINQVPSKLRNCSRKGFLLNARNLTYYLDFADIPTPNLYKLIDRYCKELCLPQDFTKFVFELIKIFPPEMNYAKYDFRVFPNFECRVLAFIIFALKLLFSLDDVTELHQSKFADTANEYIIRNKVEGIPLLFSWNSWVRFIECRKALLAKYNVSVNEQTYKNHVDNDKVFSEHWKNNQPMHKSTFERISNVFLSTLETILLKLRKKSVKKFNTDIEFPPSVTPYTSYTNYLLNNHPELVPETTRCILEHECILHSIKYLINENWCIFVAQTCELDVEVINDIATNITEHISTIDELPTLGKHGVPPALVNMHIVIDDDLKEHKKHRRKIQEFKLKRFNPEFTVFDSSEKNIMTENELIFRVYKPFSNIWLFHEMSVHSENFQDIAEKYFSSSFSWLLNLCSSLVFADIKELYTEVITVERALCCMFFDSNFSKRAPITFYANEW